MSAREVVALVLGLMFAAFAATYPLVVRMATALPNDLGDPLLVTWLLAWDASRMPFLFQGVWDAPIFFPYQNTLAYSEHVLGIALLSAPIQWVTQNPVLVYNVMFVGSFVLAGCGMYMLARSVTGRRDAALIAGLVFAFTPYRFAHIGHLQVLMSGWLPISMWGLHRYWTTGACRHLLVCGAAYVLLSLSNAYFMYFGILPLLALGCAGLLRARRPVARTALHVTLVLVMVLAALAPVIAAYYEARQLGLVRNPEEIRLYSAALEDYGRGHSSVWVWRRMGTSTGEHELFPGAVGLVLGVVALATRWRTERDVRLYGVIALLAFLLSLGPFPTAWGYRLPISGPYGWLLGVVPGLDGIRVVARLSAVVVFALAVLAAFGVAPVLDSIRAPWRRFALGATVALVVLEGWVAPIHIAAFDPRGAPIDRRAYAYLAQAPPGGVLELPMSQADPARELTYQYMTLIHGHPIVNGYSGYETPLLALVRAAVDTPTTLLEVIRNVGVRYVVLHPEAFEDRRQANALVEVFEAEHSHVVTQRRFERALVFELKPQEESPAEPEFRLVPSSAVDASASHGSQRVAFLFDHDIDSRWSSGVPQTGDEWIELTLDRPRDISRVRLQTAERSLVDYPRELAIDVTEGGVTRTVYRGSVLGQFARGLVQDGHYPFIEFDLPPNHAERIHLRQLGMGRLYWSIHELQLWER